MKKQNKRLKQIKRIWLFTDENGDITPFLKFDDAHKYAFEIYDKDLKFDGLANGLYSYVNSWNSEDVYIQALDLTKLGGQVFLLPTLKGLDIRKTRFI